MTDLSPAAQAVFNAYLENCDGAYNEEWYKGDLVMIAAALRAAADQVVPKFWHEDNAIYGETMQDVRQNLIAIAAELEAQ